MYIELRVFSCFQVMYILLSLKHWNSNFGDGLSREAPISFVGSSCKFRENELKKKEYAVYFLPSLSLSLSFADNLPKPEPSGEYWEVNAKYSRDDSFFAQSRVEII